MHFIREETLKLFVLQRIFDVTALFFDDAMAFEEVARKQRFQEAEKEAKKRRREIAQAEKRIAELDRIFKRIYEDDISGTISHERFLKLSADYEEEQKLSLIHIYNPINFIWNDRVNGQLVDKFSCSNHIFTVWY